MLPQAAEDGAGGTWQDILALARGAEDGGADSLWLSDHFFYREAGQPIGAETGYHEPWTLLSALAATTTRVELGTLVLATSFRPPGLLAKMAATADDVSGGRLILGLGCGWHEPEYEAFGYPFDHRVGRFEEALRIIVPLIHGERVTVDGVWSQVRDAAIRPAPIRTDLPILVAAKGERMLRLTARFADSWQTAWFGRPDERYRERHAALVAACETEGRDPASLQVTVGVSVEEGDAPTARRRSLWKRPRSPTPSASGEPPAPTICSSRSRHRRRPPSTSSSRGFERQRAEARPAAKAPSGRGAASAPATLRRLVLVGRPPLGVLDLLEDLAHAGSHEVAGLRLGLAVTPPDPGSFAAVDLIVVHRGPRRIMLLPRPVKPGKLTRPDAPMTDDPVLRRRHP